MASVSADFNPRVPCGTRPRKGEADAHKNAKFQPTRPLRDATGSIIGDAFNKAFISTHASLAGRDVVVEIIHQVQQNFNPRVPCGTRRFRLARLRVRHYFNPRVPCGTRPAYCQTTSCHDLISTHASLAGRDGVDYTGKTKDALFQPTRPLRDATDGAGHLWASDRFQPTRPLRDATSAL